MYFFNIAKSCVRKKVDLSTYLLTYFIKYARSSERSQCIEPGKGCSCNVFKSMFEWTCALRLRRLCSRALVNQGMIFCSNFLRAARMKRKDLDLDEKNEGY